VAVSQKNAPQIVSDLAERYLPAAGYAISFSALAGIFAAHLAIRSLAKKWKRESGGTGASWLPPLAGAGVRLATNIGLLAGFGPALVIATIWSIIFLQNLPGHIRSKSALALLIMDHPIRASMIGSGILVLAMVIANLWCGPKKKSAARPRSSKGPNGHRR